MICLFIVIYWAKLFRYCTLLELPFTCVIIGRYCWIIFKERLEWLEPWQVSLGGEHYLFPEPPYFINISITNLILLCDPSSYVLPCIHCCSGGPSLRAISQYEGIRQCAEGKTFSGQVKVLTLFTSLKLGSNAIWISIKSHCPCWHLN